MKIPQRIRVHPLQNHGNQNGSADVYNGVRYDGLGVISYSDIYKTTHTVWFIIYFKYYETVFKHQELWNDSSKYLYLF